MPPRQGGANFIRARLILPSRLVSYRKICQTHLTPRPHQAKCAKCHAFENPADYDADEWADEIMPKMAKKSKLSFADESAVLAYLLAARQMPPPADPN